jgi:ferredoxin
LLPLVHPVDRAATCIWFSFFPLPVHELVEREGESRDFQATYQMRGRYRLRDLVDRSHDFLFGHHLWPDVKAAVLAWNGPPPDTLAALAKDLAAATGPIELSLGITLVGLMTLRQAGRKAMASAEAAPAGPRDSADRVLRARATDARKGFLIRSRQPRVIFREDREGAWFAVAAGQEITSAAGQDKRPFHLEDSRCFENMGPIPVECRSGKCGTCWIGVLGGNERLSAIEDWERKRLQYFGYLDAGFEDPQDPRPRIRLACQARVESGSVSIVIPPWCGVPARGVKR